MRARGRFGSGRRAAFTAWIYAAKFEEAIYVLHCFQKKTQVTSKQDKATAAARHRAVVNGKKQRKIDTEIRNVTKPGRT